jgi:hypothetical protein
MSDERKFWEKVGDEKRKTWLAQIEDGSMQAQVVNYYTSHTSHTVPYDAHALQIAAKQNTDANCWINTLLLRIKALQAELEAQRADEPAATDELEQKPRYTMAELLAQCEPAAMSDPPQSDHQGGEGATPKGPVDTVIDHLDKRLVPRSDRIRLRGALDAADAPQTGRAGADEALGRVTRFMPPLQWGRW